MSKGFLKGALVAATAAVGYATYKRLSDEQQANVQAEAKRAADAVKQGSEKVVAQAEEAIDKAGYGEQYRDLKASVTNVATKVQQEAQTYVDQAKSAAEDRAERLDDEIILTTADLVAMEDNQTLLDQANRKAAAADAGTGEAAKRPMKLTPSDKGLSASKKQALSDSGQAPLSESKRQGLHD